MVKKLLLWVCVSVLIALCGCSKENGLISGSGNGIALKSIGLTPTLPTLTLKVSAPQPFVATGYYSQGNPQDITKQVTWTSADTTVATVDSNGVATAVGSGRTYIYASAPDPVSGKIISARTILTVVPLLTAITVNPSSAQIAKGTAQQFQATGAYNDGTNVNITALVTWNSSTPATATVSASPGTQGEAAAGTPGSTNITASLGSVSSMPSVLTVTNANLIGIAVTPADSTVPLASSQQLAASGSFDDGSNQDISATVTWSSSSPATARVASTGLVTGLGLGDSDIKAVTGAVNGSTTVTVDSSTVAKVEVLPSPTIANGTRRQMRAVAVFKDGGTLEVTQTPGLEWTSGAGATIGSTGLATATTPGAATIAATLGTGGPSGSTNLHVSSATIHSLVVAPVDATIAPGATQNIVALATFSDASQQDISSSATWSDPTGFATFTYATGLQELAQGVSTGTAAVTASFSGVSNGAPAALNVSAADLTGIKIAPGSAAIPLAGGYQFAATGSFSDGTQQDLTLALYLAKTAGTGGWSAANGAIGTVGAFGYTAAGGPGQTSVTATLGPQSGSASLLVNPGALARIDICAATVANPLSNCPPLDPFPPPPTLQFAEDIPFGLVAIGTFTDGTRQDITSSVHWSSSSSAVATVSNNPVVPGLATGVTGQGAVTGVAAGDVTITASAGGVSGTLPVTVTNAAVQSLTVTPIDSSISLGLTQQMIVVATLTDTSTEIVTPYVQWSTSDPAVAIVYPGGLAYSSGAGTATVTATMAGVPGSTTLTVTSP